VFDAFSVGNVFRNGRRFALNFVAGLRSTLFRLTLRYIVRRFQRLYADGTAALPFLALSVKAQTNL
jgi:hypothetical protein